MARRRTAPFVPLLYRRTICVANRKRKEKTKKTSIYYYRWWDDEGKEHRASTGCNLKSDAAAFVRDIIRNDGLKKKPQADITLGKFAEPFYKEDTCPLLKKKQVRNKGYSKDFARWTRGQVDKHLIAPDASDLVNLEVLQLQRRSCILPHERTLHCMKVSCHLHATMVLRPLFAFLSTAPRQFLRTPPLFQKESHSSDLNSQI